MITYHTSLKLKTKGFSDCIDITPDVELAIKNSRVKDGIVTITVPGSTGAVTTIEFESGAISDLKSALDRIAPISLEYAHNARWGDGNGFSHVRAALMKPSISFPIISSRITLGTWQQIVFLDFDNKPRTRSLVIMILGSEMI